MLLNSCLDALTTTYVINLVSYLSLGEESCLVQNRATRVHFLLLNKLNIIECFLGEANKGFRELGNFKAGMSIALTPRYIAPLPQDRITGGSIQSNTWVGCQSHGFENDTAQAWSSAPPPLPWIHACYFGQGLAMVKFDVDAVFVG